VRIDLSFEVSREMSEYEFAQNVIEALGSTQTLRLGESVIVDDVKLTVRELIFPEPPVVFFDASQA